ncbi:MAG: serine/threonine-protein kinase [Acidobacteriota bacterium]
MNQERWKKIDELFEAALARQGEARAEFLKGECGDDVTLRQEVESLLAHQQPTGRFIPTMIQEAAELLPFESSALSRRRDARFIPGTVIAGRYRVIGLLGKGGMGEVYRADDLKLAQAVALKFLPEKLAQDKTMRERFHREVRIARQISHPNVCRVFDIGEAQGQTFLSMEYIDGEDLATLLRRIGRLPESKAVEIAAQLCSGLAAAHSEGVLHRDLKPANVMIDGRGRAKITDFGLAGLAEDFEGAEVRAGTPAYMAPEQLAGKEVTARSDIYALGLVLYEVFTGKKVFTASSFDELMRLHESSQPPSISEHAKGVDPLVERVILRCLERDPQNRPVSVSQVAAALPGGDPLAAAIAAGETPSPEMVAAAPKKGALKPAIALSCLVGGIAMLVFMMFASMRVSPQNRIPFNKSAEVLSEKANEIINKFGYTDAPAERHYRFYADYSYFDYYVREDSSPKKFANIESGQPLFCVFIERQSPNTFEVRMTGNGLWAFDSQAESGQRTISLDTRGRLVEFSAVPPQFAEQSDTKADFSTAFQAAELNLAKFKDVSPNWTPPNAFDERKAWEGSMPDNEEIPLRVETASFQGKIVFFKLIYPWTKPDSDGSLTYTTRDWVGVFVFFGILWGIIVTAIFLAWKNLKSGSGDRKGAFKVSLAVFVLTFLGWVFSLNHVPSFFPELDRITLGFRSALYLSVLTCIMYLALEPIVRRNLPDLIVSWNRLLAGEFADPLVGRDVLLGTLVGTGHITLIYAGFYTERLVHGDFRFYFFTGALVSLRSWTAGVLSIAGGGFAYGLMFICILAVLFLLFRRRLFAGLVIFTLMVTVQILLFTQSWVYLPFTLTIATILCLAIARLGLMTMVVAQTVFMWLESTLLTTNFSAWYASGMLLTMGLIIALLAYGCKISLANQSLLGDRLLKDV